MGKVTHINPALTKAKEDLGNVVSLAEVTAAEMTTIANSGLFDIHEAQTIRSLAHSLLGRGSFLSRSINTAFQSDDSEDKDDSNE